MNKHLSLSLFVLPTVVACSTPEKIRPAPEWTAQPIRSVDNGYIVYIGHGEASTPEFAELKAEGQALEDLANECSMIPKGTRIEDRYSDKIHTGTGSWVKLAIELEDCVAGSKASDPEQIRKLANVSFTEQLQKYQDYTETGMVAANGSGTEITPPAEVAQVPQQGTHSDQVHFYMTRQYVAYEKQIVILSPPTAYAPASPESQKFANSMQAANVQMAGVMEKNPGLAAQVKNQPVAWSHVPDRPPMARPQALRAPVSKTMQNHAVQPPHVGPSRGGGRGKSGNPPPQGRRKRKRYH